MCNSLPFTHPFKPGESRGCTYCTIACCYVQEGRRGFFILMLALMLKYYHCQLHGNGRQLIEFFIVSRCTMFMALLMDCTVLMQMVLQWILLRSHPERYGRHFRLFIRSDAYDWRRLSFHPFYSIVILPGFLSNQCLPTLQERNITVFMGVPTMYSILLAAYDKMSSNEKAVAAKAAASLRLAVSGSAACPLVIMQSWKSITGTTLLERYGMTEIGMALSNPYEVKHCHIKLAFTSSWLTEESPLFQYHAM